MMGTQIFLCEVGTLFFKCKLRLVLELRGLNVAETVLGNIPV